MKCLRTDKHESVKEFFMFNDSLTKNGLSCKLKIEMKMLSEIEAHRTWLLLAFSYVRPSAQFYTYECVRVGIVSPC